MTDTPRLTQHQIDEEVKELEAFDAHYAKMEEELKQHKEAVDRSIAVVQAGRALVREKIAALRSLTPHEPF